MENILSWLAVIALFWFVYAAKMYLFTGGELNLFKNPSSKDDDEINKFKVQGLKKDYEKSGFKNSKIFIEEKYKRELEKKEWIRQKQRRKKTQPKKVDDIYKIIDQSLSSIEYKIDYTDLLTYFKKNTIMKKLFYNFISSRKKGVTVKDYFINDDFRDKEVRNITIKGFLKISVIFKNMLEIKDHPEIKSYYDDCRRAALELELWD